MPQVNALYLELSVRENVDFFARMYGMSDRRSRAQSVEEAIDMVDLGPRSSDPILKLSGGMRQRVSLPPGTRPCTTPPSKSAAPKENSPPSTKPDSLHRNLSPTAERVTELVPQQKCPKMSQNATKRGLSPAISAPSAVNLLTPDTTPARA